MHPSGTDPIVVSPTIQVFEGRRYYLCGKYFQSDGLRLHRHVWEVTNGRCVPRGYDVHHKDEDRSHNWAGNLELFEKRAHLSHHNKGKRHQFPPAAVEAAKKWHASEAGRQWHDEHYRQVAAAMHAHAEFTCAYCNRQFDAQVNGHNRFCSNNCKSQSRRAAKLDFEARTCTVCGGPFSVSRYSKTLTCSRSCGSELHRGPKSAKYSRTFTCQQCGNVFQALHHLAKFCSSNCKHKSYREARVRDQKRL